MSFRQQEAVQPQPALDLLTAIGGTKSLSMLDGFCPGAVDRLGGGAGSPTSRRRALSEAIEARRREVRGIDTAGGSRAAGGGAGQSGRADRAIFHPSGRRRGRRTGGRRSSGAGRWRRPARCRRSSPASSRPGELAALRIVADAVRDRGACMLTLGEIAARAGVCVTTARNALRDGRARGARHHRGAAARQAAEPRQCGAGGVAGMEDVDRARPANESAQGTPRVAAQGGGCKKTGSTDKDSSESYAETAFHAVNFPKMPFARRQTASCCGHRLYAASPRRGFSMKSGAARFGKTNSGEEA